MANGAVNQYRVHCLRGAEEIEKQQSDHNVKFGQVSDVAATD
jgi:hypothetical protein